jgi:hypothetical protein
MSDYKVLSSTPIRHKPPQKLDRLANFLGMHERHSTDDMNPAGTYSVNVKLRNLHYPSKKVERAVYSLYDEDTERYAHQLVNQTLLDEFDGQYKPYHASHAGRSEGHIILLDEHYHAVDPDPWEDLDEGRWSAFLKRQIPLLVHMMSARNVLYQRVKRQLNFVALDFMRTNLARFTAVPTSPPYIHEAKGVCWYPLASDLKSWWFQAGNSNIAPLVPYLSGLEQIAQQQPLQPVLRVNPYHLWEPRRLRERAQMVWSFDWAVEHYCWEYIHYAIERTKADS